MEGDDTMKDQSNENVIIGLKSRLDNDIVYLDVHSANLYVKYTDKKTKIIKLKEIKSLHTKNQDKFLLKLQLSTDSLVFGFDNFNVRDLVKNILMKFIKPEEKVIEKVLQKDSGVKQLYTNTKGVITPDTFWGVNRGKVLEMYNLMLQQPTRELNFDTEEFIYSLPPVFLKIFGEINCSIIQFYNFIKQFNFYDIRNTPNFIDRMLIDNLRDFKIETNYAVRLNNQSLVNINSYSEIKDSNTLSQKFIQFEPIYYLEDLKEERVQTGYEISNRKLKCEVDLVVEEREDEFKFDKRDMKRLVDLSKLVYKCKRDNIDLSKDLPNIEKFIKEIQKKYGEKNIKFYQRLLPTWFI